MLIMSILLVQVCRAGRNNHQHKLSSIACLLVDVFAKGRHVLHGMSARSMIESMSLTLTTEDAPESD